MRNVLSAVLLIFAIGAIVAVRAEKQQLVQPASSTCAPPPAPCPLIPVQGIPPSQLKGSFNEGRVGHYHHAIDILAPRGTPVLAAVDGTVRKLFLSRDGGIT